MVFQRETNETAIQFLKEYQLSKNQKFRMKKTYKYKIEPLKMSEICECSHAKQKHMSEKFYCTCKNCNCSRFKPANPDSYKKYLKRIIATEQINFTKKW